MKKIKNLNGYAIYQAGERDVKKYGFSDGGFYVYFASDVRDFGLPNSTPEFEDCGSLEEAEANCTGNFAIAKEIVEERTTAASMDEILEVEAMLDAGADPESLNEYDEYDEEPVADQPWQWCAGLKVVPGALYVDGQQIDRIKELELPEIRPKPDASMASELHSMEVTLTIGPKQAAAIAEIVRQAFDQIWEAARKAADWLAETLRKAAAAVRERAASFVDFMLYHANDHPKWWHLYKRAKKARTRKKYRRLLMRQLNAKLAAVT